MTDEQTKELELISEGEPDTEKRSEAWLAGAISMFSILCATFLTYTGHFTSEQWLWVFAGATAKAIQYTNSRTALKGKKLCSSSHENGGSQ